MRIRKCIFGSALMMATITGFSLNSFSAAPKKPSRADRAAVYKGVSTVQVRGNFLNSLLKKLSSESVDGKIEYFTDANVEVIQGGGMTLRGRRQVSIDASEVKIASDSVILPESMTPDGRVVLHVFDIQGTESIHSGVMPEFSKGLRLLVSELEAKAGYLESGESAFKSTDVFGGFSILQVTRGKRIEIKVENAEMLEFLMTLGNL